ncbi:hypothetical protein BJY18_000215 [Amycolatopsis jiangsuensis]|uniref:Uncharacterized protein n=1 Tax=Amycolatopsis jiangsuensis TaxID=1181879 RepID=A0A840IL63_9PSEU|nr:hypothetical protein [Amycolatopsis jiangsuensis]
MAHCSYCCLPVALTKTRRLPKHYSDSIEFLGWAQVECKGSGTARYDSSVRACRRRRSRQACPHPHCGRKLTLKKNGKFPVHDNLSGKECRVSEDNRT